MKTHPRIQKVILTENQLKKLIDKLTDQTIIDKTKRFKTIN